MKSTDYIFIGPAPPYRGGIANYNMELATSFTEIGTVQILNFTTMYPEIFFPGTSQFLTQPKKVDIDSERVLSSINPFNWYAVARCIQVQKPKAVIFQWWNPFFAPAYFFITRQIAQKNIPVIFICHNVIPHEATVFDQMLLRLAFRNVDRFVTQSQEEKQKLLDFSPGATVSVNVHPGYERFPFPAPEFVPPVQLPDAELVLLFFGLIREYKGVIYLLQAIPQVKECIDIHLIIAGEFYDSPFEYYNLIETLNIESNVTVVNRYVPDKEVGWYFQQADLVVLPYVSATQSGIIPLAYHFLKPVIATRVGGLPDVVFPGKTGYLVSPKDSDAIVAGIKEYLRDREKTDFQKEIKSVLPLFSWNHLRQTILELINS